MKKLLALLFILPFVSCTNVMSNKDITALDSRNAGIDMEVRYKGIFNHKDIVFDIESVSDENSMADVFRAFLQAASKLKDESFDKIEFAYKGKSKMYIDGYYFKTLGREFGDQNIIYTIRTFPENVKDMNGNSAFESWTGGLFMVAKEQMEDFNEFNEKWYMSELPGGNL